MQGGALPKSPNIDPYEEPNINIPTCQVIINVRCNPNANPNGDKSEFEAFYFPGLVAINPDSKSLTEFKYRDSINLVVLILLAL